LNYYANTTIQCLSNTGKCECGMSSICGCNDVTYCCITLNTVLYGNSSTFTIMILFVCLFISSQ
jgi:hypothetical protein